MKKTWQRLLKIENFCKKKTLWFCVPLFLIVLVHCAHPYQQGERLYIANCERCHGMEGQGFEQLYPSLSESAFIKSKSKHLPCIISHGSHFLQSLQNSESMGGMPENPHLSAIEILNITNYLYYKFEIGYTEKISNVEAALEGCKH